MFLCCAGGGASTVHPHSALVIDTRLYLAVGDPLICLDMEHQTQVWSAVVDDATCFGVYRTPDDHGLLSHGELSIARVGFDGRVQWQSSGADVFSEPIRIDGDAVTATDFEGQSYRFDLVSGKLLT